MQQTIGYIRKSLNPLYPATETESFIRLIIEKVCGLTFTDYLLHKNNVLPDNQRKEIEKITDRLKNFEPIQYILGYAPFLDFDFQVSPAVLIPRPETEELVDLIRRRHSGQRLRILDIGTGSGCIAVSLARLLPGSYVEAWDISPAALKCARQKARNLYAEVRFKEKDILSPIRPDPAEKFDLIVSNPPYVCEREKADMSRNVLDYEPATALFVPDDDPLRFYAAIAGAGHSLLKKQGKLYVEINARYGEDTIQAFQEYGYEKTELMGDLYGKSRFVAAVRKECNQ